MLITRDKAKLRNVPLVRLTVEPLQHGSPLRRGQGNLLVRLSGRGKGGQFGPHPFVLPVEQAFDKARRFAKEKNISAIWIDDPDERFPDQLFEMALSE